MWLFLSTGIRAVDHCVEGVCSNGSTEFTNASALHGLGDAGARPAQGEGRSRRTCGTGSTARSARGCRWARLAAGVPMGASHGIGYVLGAVFDVPHGHTSCIMLPSVMRWNKSANADRQALIANAMGHPARTRATFWTSSSAASACRAACGEVKIGKEHFERIAAAGHGHALGAAQSAQDRQAGAGEGDPGAGGTGRLEFPQFPQFGQPLCLSLAFGVQACQRNSDFPVFPVFPTRAWCWAEVSAYG